MRSINYNSEAIGGNQMDVFRFRKLDNIQNRPVIFPQIIDHWVADKAYLKLVTNVAADSIIQEMLLIKDENNSDTIILKANRPNEQTQIAIKMHEALKNEKQVFAITKDGKQVLLLEDKMDRYYFSIIMKDYYRLTDIM